MNILSRIDENQAAISALHPFTGHLLEQIRAFYRVGLTWSSNAIEGNTLTESETKVLLEDGLTIGGKPLRDTFEAYGHAKAYDYMFTLLGSKRITEDDVLTLHALFYGSIESENAGRYRDMTVIITGSNYPVTSVENIAAEVKSLCNWVDCEREKYHPVMFAAELHRRFVFIHPFKDGNGRVARLLMNTALIQDGFLPIAIPPILRQQYIDLLEKGHRNAAPFNEFIAECELESQKDMMRMLHIGEQKPGLKKHTDVEVKM